MAPPKKNVQPTSRQVRRQKQSLRAGLPDPGELQTAKGGRAKKLQVAEIFTERRESQPGDWIDMKSSRVIKARYDYGLEQIHVIFRDGTPWVYDQVPYTIWTNFQRSASHGQFINSVLNSYPYRRGDFTGYDWEPG